MSRTNTVRRVKKLLAIHSNPVNLVGALVVLYALLMRSLSHAVIGAFVWTIGFVYQKRFRCYSYKPGRDT